MKSADIGLRLNPPRSGFSVIGFAHRFKLPTIETASQRSRRKLAEKRAAEQGIEPPPPPPPPPEPTPEDIEWRKHTFWQPGDPALWVRPS